MAIDSLINDDDYFYKKKVLQDKILQIKNTKIKKFIFSNEDIVTSRFLSLTAERLKELLPNSRIVLSIRNQNASIKSWYISHGSKLKLVPKKYWNKFVDFNDWFQYIITFKNLSVTPHQISPLEAMNYERIYKTFSKVFGEQNIKIIVYENFFYEKKTFFSDWSNLIDIKPEVIENNLELSKIERLRETQIHFNLRKFFSFLSFSGLFEKNLKKFNFGNKAKIDLDDEQLNIIKDNFSEGNKYLNEKLNLELQKFGYPL